MSPLLNLLGKGFWGVYVRSDYYIHIILCINIKLDIAFKKIYDYLLKYKMARVLPIKNSALVKFFDYLSAY